MVLDEERQPPQHVAERRLCGDHLEQPHLGGRKPIGRPPFRHVGEREGHAVRAPVSRRRQRLRVERQPDEAAVPSADAAHDVVVRASGAQRVERRELVGRGGRSVLAHRRPVRVSQPGPHDLRALDAQDALRTRIAGRDAAVGVEQDDALGHRGHDGLVARFAGVQGMVGGRIGDDDPEALPEAVGLGQRVVVDPKRAGPGRGVHAHDRRARPHHAPAELGCVGRERREDVGDPGVEELPARTTRQRCERPVRARHPQVAVKERAAHRHALQNRFEKRHGRRCRRRVAVHRLQGVLLGSGGGAYRPSRPFAGSPA